MKELLPALLFAAAGLAALYVTLPPLLKWWHKDDRAASIHYGPIQDGPETPLPDVIACKCDTCHAIRCVDGRWLPERMVPLPFGCRISHGRCPICNRAAMAELDRVLPRSEAQPA